MKYRILIFFPILSLFGCNEGLDTKNCIEGNRLDVPSLDLSEYGLELCGVKRDDPAKNFNVVIDSTEKLKEYIYCQQYPDFDFEKYVILGGLYVYHQCVGLESEELFICKGKLVYQINLYHKDCLAVTEIPYFKLVERKYADMGVYFDINFN